MEKQISLTALRQKQIPINNFINNYFVIAPTLNRLIIFLSVLIHGPNLMGNPWTNRVVVESGTVLVRADYLPAENPSRPDRPFFPRVTIPDIGHDQDPTNFIIGVSIANQQKITPGMDQIGPIGSPLWVVSPHGTESSLNIVFSDLGLKDAPGAESIEFDLGSVVGPGSVVIWENDPFEGIKILADSRRVGPSLSIRPLGLLDRRFYIGFRSNGVHQVTFNTSINGDPSFLGAGPDISMIFAVEPYVATDQLRCVLSYTKPYARGNRIYTMASAPNGRYLIQESTDLSVWRPAFLLFLQERPFEIAIGSVYRTNRNVFLRGIPQPLQ